MNRLNLIFKRNGEPMSGEPVAVRYRKNFSDQEITEKTNENGQVEINCPADEVSSVEAAGIVVKGEWYIEGGKEEYFEVPDPASDPNLDITPAKGWHLVKIKLSHPGSVPAANTPVTFVLKSGGFFSDALTLEGRTNSDGWVRIHIKEDTIEEISVAGVRIMENFYVGGRPETEDYIEIPEAGKGIDQEKQNMIYKIEGQLYYSDGTQPYKEIEVVIESDHFIGAERVGQFSDDKGHFFIDLPEPMENRFLYEFRWFVSGEKIDRKRIHFHNNFTTMILPEINFIGKNGLDGGVVTGRVVDKHGEAIANMKVAAQVRTGSVTSTTFSTNWVETKTNKYGYFALGFSGGTEIQNITVEGKTPSRIYKKKINKDTGEKIEVDITSPILRAGSFNIQLESGWKMFGSF